MLKISLGALAPDVDTESIFPERTKTLVTKIVYTCIFQQEHGGGEEQFLFYFIFFYKN